MRPGDTQSAPLVVHVLHSFAVGGLENGVVNLVNRLDRDRFRHKIVALTDVSPEFARRLQRSDIECIALAKPPGSLVPLYPRLYRMFREWRPAVVHTRNLAALEAAIPAWAARVPARVHGEHGRDVSDLDGTSVKYRWIRRLYAPFVQRWIALSQDLERYLVDRVGVSRDRVTQIYNGVDTDRFVPANGSPVPISGCPFTADEHWIVGTVGRMQTVKNQTLLVRAFIRMREGAPAAAERARLVLAGDGPLLAKIRPLVTEAGIESRVWFAGERHDIPEILRGLHCFVLPSLAEGVSNTILEAMASGLPVVATAVGGNPELVADGVTGRLVPSEDVEAMADALSGYLRDPTIARAHGAAARVRSEERFSLVRMTSDYAALYESMLGGRRSMRTSPATQESAS